ncbi:hypothetical protein TcasGA2_TC014618 [Tribolium castaneum]|uniref:Uncharacterized protein n=1 Tax=Tribolium castaneum TaxID=7070 RepID=D6WMY9_TRICA|nr:hypothetical protein TcasGA2_TC014618 [Tribolium castaneum]
MGASAVAVPLRSDRALDRACSELAVSHQDGPLLRELSSGYPTNVHLIRLIAAFSRADSTNADQGRTFNTFPIKRPLTQSGASDNRLQHPLVKSQSNLSQIGRRQPAKFPRTAEIK